MDLVTPAMRSIIGRPFRTTVSHPIDASATRRWAIAVYYPDDPPAELIADSGLDGIPGPLVAEDFNPFAWSSASTTIASEAIETDPEFERAGAYEHLLGVEPPALRTGINGGLAISYGDARMSIGDVITSTSSIADYRQRSGRLGEMLFTTTEDVWTTQTGQHVKTVRMTLIRY